MTEVIVLFSVLGFIFVFILYAIFMLVLKKKKSLKKPFLVSLILFFFLGCFTVYRTVTKTYNKIAKDGGDLIVKGASKTGSLVGKSATAFGKSAYDGAGNVLRNQVILSKQLRAKGVEVGNIEQDQGHILQVYIIFNKTFKANITAKVKNTEGEELGRVTSYVEGEQGEATYIPFVFDFVTDIPAQSKIFFE